MPGITSARAAANWSGQIFAYCERGLDPTPLAEPLNAASNAMFFVAAAAGLAAWFGKPKAQRGAFELMLIGLVVCIGIGSTLFHTLATRWAAAADSIPIAVFMLCYVVFTLRRFFALSRLWSAAGLLGFVAMLAAAGAMRCGSQPCFNGSIAYVPALVALAAAGGVLALQRHPAASAMLTAAALFMCALSARTLDRAACPWTVIAGHTAGTHALWHLLNGVLLLILLQAAIRHGRLRGSLGSPDALAATGARV